MKADMVLKDKKPVTTKEKRKPMKTIYKISILFLVLLLISLSFEMFKKNNSECVSLTAHFTAVSEGKNPDGSPFNISEVLSDEVLERAVDKLEGEIDVETLRKHLSVSDNVSANNLKNLEKEIVDGNTQYTYFPNMYTLTYSVVSENVKNEGFIASIKAIAEQKKMPDKKEILNCVAESYSEYYAEKYVAGTVTLDVDWTNVDKLDYYNKAEKIKDEVRKICRFVLEKYDREPEFKAENGVGYGDLYTEIGQILNVDTENYSAYIIQNGLSNNKKNLMLQFRYMQNLNMVTNIRKFFAYEITKGAIDVYDAGTTKVVFIPALDSEQSFYMNRTKVGMDYLVENANEAKTESDNAQNDAEKYAYLQEHFYNSEASPEAYVIADNMYVEIKGKIDSFNLKAEEIMSEASEKNDKKSIEVGKTFSNYGVASMGVNGAKVFAILLIVFYVAYILITGIKKKLFDKVSGGAEK